MTSRECAKYMPDGELIQPGGTLYTNNLPQLYLRPKRGQENFMKERLLAVSEKIADSAVAI